MIHKTVQLLQLLAAVLRDLMATQPAEIVASSRANRWASRVTGRIEAIDVSQLLDQNITDSGMRGDTAVVTDRVRRRSADSAQK